MGWRDWTRSLRRRSDADFAAEIESHLAFEVDRLVASGMSRVEAEQAARRAFGNVTSSRERYRESRPWRAIDALAQDARYALRGMRRSPAFTTIAVLSLALGIGVNTTMFTVVDRLLVRTPPHVRDADHVHRVTLAVPSDGGGTAYVATEGYGLYMRFRDRAQGLEAIGAYYPTGVSSGRGPDARKLDAVLVTPSMLRLLGVSPARGRLFDDSEERDEGDHVAIIGHHLWRDRFGGDEAILGKSIDVEGLPYTIVGVAPEGFSGIDIDRVDLWVPIGIAERLYGRDRISANLGSYWLQMVARRAPGVDRAVAEASLTAIYRDRWREDSPPGLETSRFHAVLAPVVAARGPAPERDARIALWVAAVSLIVLLMASANVANLLLLRGLQRSRELALRLSLGATRGRLVRQAVVEGTLITAAGTLGALVMARWSAAAMREFFLPRTEGIGVLEPRILAFTALIALTTGLLAALVPAVVTARREMAPVLGAARATMGRSRLMLQRVLVGVQVTLATLLLVGAGLFVTSLRNVRAVDLGIDVDHVLYVALDAGSDAAVPASVQAARTEAVYRAALERVRSLPAVASASLNAGETMESGWGVWLLRRGQPGPKPGDSAPMGRAVGEDYFVTMGTRLVRGRYFTAADHRAGSAVAIIDQATAERMWPDGDPLDPCVRLHTSETCTEIVGVVANTVLWEVIGERGSVVYVPLESWKEQAVSMMEVRTHGDPHDAIPALRAAIAAAAPGLPWVNITPLSDRIAPQFRPWRLAASMFTAFGALALTLAAIGLYGILSHVVTQRTQEIGIRRALGASDRGIFAMVVRGGLWLTVPAVVGGIALALAAGRLVASELFGIAANDARALLVGAGSLIIVALVACLAPARRATKVDPMDTLRMD